MFLELFLLSVGRLWASFWDSLGRLELPKGGLLGVILASLWLPWDSLGHLGHLGLQSGPWDDLGSKMDVRLREYLERLRCLLIKSDLARFSAGSPGSAISTQSGTRAVAPNPTSLAPGARMTVVKHTPQIIIIIIAYCILPI